MRGILICPNAFKGSLTAGESARAIAAGIRRSSGHRVELLPLADGGDGVLETLVETTGGKMEQARVHDPLGRTIPARWGRLGADGGTAVIEMAEASGLRLLKTEERDPLRASTQGTGELMRAALDAGCRTLLVGIGGSATNDGGAGVARALGVRFLDRTGAELPPGGAALSRLARIDITGLRLPDDAVVIAACDVDNPLCGPEGASAVYGPQKGASRQNAAELDAALGNYARILKDTVGADVMDVPGSGAAGGLGAGLLAFCRARLQPGAEMVMDAVGFDERISRCDLAITGEGKLDEQTTRGKVISGVSRRCRLAGVPLIALAGSIQPGAEAALREIGLTCALPIVEAPMTVEEAMQHGARLLSDTAERLMRVLALAGRR